MFQHCRVPNDVNTSVYVPRYISSPTFLHFRSLLQLYFIHTLHIGINPPSASSYECRDLKIGMRTAIRKTWSGMERDGIGVEVYCGARSNPWYPRHCKHACSRPPVICMVFAFRNFICRTCIRCLPASGEITVLCSQLYALQNLQTWNVFACSSRVFYHVRKLISKVEDTHPVQ